ncbi:unnamed protein product [Lactuca saligna]|uniref:Stalled ribosome sensor GCN1-like HEAT repeats region domain-containing protein n=1 Tax=Lactuca saligna TaxID=75948 RepID=A0AA35Z3K7_LACSI|nr:unnamed protein product [Lactuca saligna]
MISTLIILLSDTDSATVSAAWEALSRVVGSVPKEVLPSYIKLVCDAVCTSRDKERRKKKGGPIVIPGLCLPKALQPSLPIYLQGLISGSAKLREHVAQGLGELIEVTSVKALKEFVIPVTGYKPPLSNACRTTQVRSSAALALGKLSALSTRVDPLVGDLLSNLQTSEGGVCEAILVALKGIVKHAGKSVSGPIKTRVFDLLQELIYNDDDQIRNSSSKILGIILEYLEDDQISELLDKLPENASSPTWTTRHGSLLTISSMLRHIPTVISASPSFTVVTDCLKNSLTDEKRYDPPPSYPYLKIPGLNAPIPLVASFGYHPGGWGKWLGSRKIRCNWATKSVGVSDERQGSDSKSVVELTNGSSGKVDGRKEYEAT